MSGLVDFLLARITEDEASARECKEWGDCFACPAHERFDTARVLAEVKSKRRIVEEYQGAIIRVAAFKGDEQRVIRAFTEALRGALAHLALPHADHPDYREEWRV